VIGKNIQVTAALGRNTSRNSLSFFLPAQNLDTLLTESEYRYNGMRIVFGPAWRRTRLCKTKKRMGRLTGGAQRQDPYPFHFKFLSIDE
jgi:hypothetical protein